MTTEEALKVAADPLGNPPHAVIQAARVLADALREAQARCVRLSETRHAMFAAVLPGKAMRDDKVGQVKWAVSEFERRIAEAQAQTVQMREVVRQDHCDYGDACVLHKMKEVVSTLPAPAARTYDDGVRDAAKAVRDQAIRTFGKLSAVADHYARVVEALLSPAPAVAPVAQNTVTGGWKMEATQTFPAPVAAPKPATEADRLEAEILLAERTVRERRGMPDHIAACEAFARDARPKLAMMRAAEKPAAFDAEAALVAMRWAFDTAHDQIEVTVVDVRSAIDAGLAAGRGAR